MRQISQIYPILIIASLVTGIQACSSNGGSTVMPVPNLEQAARKLDPNSDLLIVPLQPGGTAEHYDGSIKGEKTIAYLVGATAGTTLNVQMESLSSALSFKIIDITSGKTVFTGPVGADNQFIDELQTTSSYAIIIFLNQQAAESNEKSDYSIDIGLE